MNASNMRDVSAAARRVCDCEHVDVHAYDTIDSTNAEAKRNALTETGTTLYIARAQTNGRGRLGRNFYSPADTGLYMTLALTTDCPLSATVRITAQAAVSAASAIEFLTDKRPRIKWVNDLYLNGGKLAGILTEAVALPNSHYRILVGIGINLTTASLPDSLHTPATCLFGQMGNGVSADFTGTLAGEIVRRLLHVIDSETLPDGETCLDFYRRHLLYVGERVIYSRGNETFAGTVIGVNDTYELLIESEHGVTVLDSGEISVRPYGD